MEAGEAYLDADSYSPVARQTMSRQHRFHTGSISGRTRLGTPHSPAFSSIPTFQTPTKMSSASGCLTSRGLRNRTRASNALCQRRLALKDFLEDKISEKTSKFKRITTMMRLKHLPVTITVRGL
ncbi:predicted protein [Plenodomus lingam JN3]|uniref:Predicted protein n=1 Tax=Leptosphaeria maculans (strain JN3 / isolate v23.1.3 / race Av1-4-5-6-7-8) TaxID=985895 RepID=E4ZZF5_LEPMJ|nr:predicted protein [Plenodomus lingam JN3]CBX96750.1 predicted protein [Plenodomus lingam JN3]